MGNNTLFEEYMLEFIQLYNTFCALSHVESNT